MGLFKNRNVFRISPTDWVDNYLSEKIVAGENVSIDLEGGQKGEQLVVSANKTQGRKVRHLNSSGVINADEYLVLVDASKEHVVVTLPPANDYLGQLSIVCLAPDFGIDIIPNKSTTNTIFDMSSVQFNFKGDSVTFVSDRGIILPTVDAEDLPEDLTSSQNSSVGSWYVVGRYSSSWYY